MDVGCWGFKSYYLLPPFPFLVSHRCLSTRTFQMLCQGLRALSLACILCWELHCFVFFQPSISAFEPLIPRSWDFWLGNREWRVYKEHISSEGSRKQRKQYFVGEAQMGLMICDLWGCTEEEKAQNGRGQRERQRKEKRRGEGIQR